VNLADFLIDTFNLYEHYDIDPEGRQSALPRSGSFYELYEVTKTKRDAIELSVEDTDKALAAKIANAARDKIDATVQQLMKESP
jgi:tyrosine-protein kinase Etk/Wzc